MLINKHVACVVTQANKHAMTTKYITMVTRTITLTAEAGDRPHDGRVLDGKRT